MVQSLDAAAARDWSNRILERMQADRSHFVDVATDLQDNGLQERIAVDRDRADALGVDPASLRTALEAGFGTLTATQIQATGNSYDVILEYDQSGAWTDSRLSAIRVPAANGTLVPLTAFATLSRERGPSPSTDGAADGGDAVVQPAAGVSLGTATGVVEDIKAQVGLPSNVTTSYAGTAQVFQQATGNLGLLIGAAVLVIYIVLGILYESFIHR